MAFNIPQQNIDDATDTALSWHARQFNKTLPPDPAVGDSQPFNQRPGALNARQWTINKQAEFIAWAVSEYAKEVERRRQTALKNASTATIQQVDGLIGTTLPD